MIACVLWVQSGREEVNEWDDAELDDTIVRDFHFGGGFVRKERVNGDAADAEEAPERPKSKKEVGLPRDNSLKR